VVKKLIIIGLLILAIGFLGCAPKFVPNDKQYQLDVKFEPTPKYNIDLSTITKPEKPVKIWVDEKFQVTDEKNAKYLILAPQEYAKYIAQLQIKETYREIIEKQEILINTYIDQINALKELVALEHAKAMYYRQLWVDSENAYQQEKYDHQVSNTINRVITGIITVGAIVVCILAL
jgi:hypothetical protein